ncbi:hypothetical protein [Hubei tetragnatha maxillosa virus 4]|uniref:hypothetical protein n=1 Tax=Hubei tetragnatha maxillosa virus 4 TaxID=1923246 RepID=UPI00090C88EA|nr:hypothetical protein [Hubei tetragnatha maxillosa virus 4]APG76661.1 hypothetical protein [Hubei tetragnatha maxillosa virus 4]APG77449.1 hypothetical protein [Hubei tetragnatha maxillosa virus 4]
MFDQIQKDFASDPTIKWRIINEIRKTRVINITDLSMKDGQLYIKDHKVSAPWDILAHMMPSIHVAQTKVKTLSGPISELLSSMDIFDTLKKQAKLQLAQSFTSILTSIYSIIRNPSDLITWTFALANLTTTIMMVVSLCKVTSKFRKFAKAVVEEDLHPDVLQAILSSILENLDPSKHEEADSAAHSSPKEDCAFHNVQTEITAEEYETLLKANTYKVHTETGVSHKGSGPFNGCLQIITTENETHYFSCAPHSNQSSDHGLFLAPGFTAVLSIIYVLAVSGMTYAGFTNVKALLDLSRLKNEMKTSVKDVKDFLKFVAQDMCGFDIAGDVSLMKGLDQQVIVNQNLLEKKAVEFVINNALYFELVDAMKDTRTKLSTLSASPELRSSQQAFTMLLTSTLAQLGDKKAAVIRLKTTLSFRPDVVVIFLHGQAGVGKTTLARHIVDKMATGLGIKKDIYNINFPENGHWPAYAGQQFAIYDEFGAQREKDPIIKHFNGMVSTGYFSMDGADLELKPQPCGIRVLIVIGNTPRWPMLNSLSKEAIAAFWSRIPTYHVEFPNLKNLKNRNDTTGRRPDFSHLTITSEVYPNSDHEHKPASTAPIHLDELINNACQEYIAHGTAFTSQLNAKLETDDKPQHKETNHLVFNVTGPSGRGKTTTFLNEIIPRFSEYCRNPFVHITTIAQLQEPRAEPAIYLIDDILTTSAAPSTVASYVEFYNSVAYGSVIILVSNMVDKKCLGVRAHPYFKIPIPFTLWSLPKAYADNDACLRRMGLEGWVRGSTSDVFVDGVGTRMYFDGYFHIGGQQMGLNDVTTHMNEMYYRHLEGGSEYTVLETPEITEPSDDDYVKISNMTREELANIISNGGLAIMQVLGRKIKIPKSVLDNFSLHYPIENFKIDGLEKEDILKIGPRLLKLFRRNCPTTNVYIDLGDVKIMSRGRLLFVSKLEAHHTKTQVIQDHQAGQDVLRVVTAGGEITREIVLPLHSVFSWFEGDTIALDPRTIWAQEFAALNRWCKNNPCSLRKFYRARAWTQCEAQLAVMQSRFLPQAVKFLQKIPAIEIILALAGIVCTAWVVTRIVRSFQSAVDVNQGQNMYGAQVSSPGTAKQPEPDIDDYRTWRAGSGDIRLSKETAHFFNLDAYDRDLARWKRDNNAQMLSRPIVTGPPSVDVVVQAAVNSVVRCESGSIALHGHMIYGRVGLTNAHLFGAARFKDQSITPENFRFSVEHKGRAYQAMILDLHPAHDIMIFFVDDTKMPLFPDIRGYFYSITDYRNGETVDGALVKYRETTILEKCTLTYDQRSANYWHQQTQTGVVSRGISASFITSMNGMATKEGDCGSFYISVGNVHGTKQHARIMGIHVGMRSGVFPHATATPRELLMGETVITQASTTEYQLRPMGPNKYGITGDELLDDFTAGVIDGVAKIESPFPSDNISVLGVDRKQYVEPLKPARVQTGYVGIVEKFVKETSGTRPTTTLGIRLPEDAIKNSTGQKDHLLNQFKSYGDVLPKMDEKHLKDVTEWVKTDLASRYSPNKSIPRMDEIINGFQEGHPLHGTVNRINMDASAGVYFQRKYSVNTIRELFTLGENNRYYLAETPAAEDYFSRANLFVRQLHQGKVPQTITKTCLKSELRPVEKVEKGVIRTFDVSDASVRLAHRMILMPTMCSIQIRKDRLAGPIQIGINALTDFPVLFDRLSKDGGKLLQLDFSEFDRHLSYDLIRASYEVALHIKDPEKDHSVLAEALAKQTCCTYRLVGNTLVQTFQGMSSGFYFTSLGDSIANYIMLVYVLTKVKNKGMQWFKQNVDCIILGDDISVRVSEELSNELDLNAVLEEYRRIGAKPTAADKKSEVALQPFEELSFCSRTVRRSANGVILCPLKKRSILALLEWVTESKRQQYIEDGQVRTHSTLAQIADNTALALSEASLHKKTFYDKILSVAKLIVKDLRMKNAPEYVINKIDLFLYHRNREALAEDIIYGRESLKIIYDEPSNHQNQSSDTMTSPVSLVYEWAAKRSFSVVVKQHTIPIGSEPSKCIIQITCDRGLFCFEAHGSSRNESKKLAFAKAVIDLNIDKEASTSLEAFCNLMMVKHQIIKTTYFDGTEWVVYYQPNKQQSSIDWIDMGISAAKSDATLEAMRRLSKRYPEKHVQFVETGEVQVSGLNESHSIVPTNTPSNAGLSATAHAPDPVVSRDITPNTSAPVADQTPLLTMVGGPNVTTEHPNMLTAPDMLDFGGVDFTVRDAAHNQIIDHNPSIAISQAAVRGTIIAIEDYNPYNKNVKIQEWVKLHSRYVGSITIRLHLIAQPIFMGEIVVSWQPDVRGMKVGDILPDDVLQLYSWKTMSLQQGATEFMTLQDARSDKFFRTDDIAGEDARMARPGLVVAIYQAMVNPFDNLQAACYLNIGSCLGPDFRPSDPRRPAPGGSPTDPQSNNSNSLVGKTFGTVFQEAGIEGAPEIFMSTDGTFFPSQNALVTTPSSQGEKFPPINFPAITATWGAQSPDVNVPAAEVSYGSFSTEEAMSNANIISMVSAKSFGSAGASFIILQGSYPTSPQPTSWLNRSLSKPTWEGMRTAFANAIAGPDSITNYATVSGTVNFSLNGSTWSQINVVNMMELAWGNDKLQVWGATFGAGNSDGARISLRQPLLANTVSSVVYRYPILSLQSNQELLRFGAASFPALTYTNSNLPSSTFNEFEQAMLRYFKTITSTTGGFVQFALLNPLNSQPAVNVRYDSAVGFTITSVVQTPFAQYNGPPVNNLTFANVIFGNRTSVFPATDTTTWINRRGALPTFASPRRVKSAVLADYLKTKTVPEEPTEQMIMSSLVQELQIERKIQKYVPFVEEGQIQAAAAGMAAAGALSGMGTALGGWLTSSKQNDLERELQRNQQSFEKLMQSRRYKKEAELFDQNMRSRVQASGAMAPINQLQYTANQNQGNTVYDSANRTSRSSRAGNRSFNTITRTS